MTVNRYNPLEYVTRDTRTLISQCNVNLPQKKEKDYAGARYYRDSIEISVRLYDIVYIWIARRAI